MKKKINELTTVKDYISFAAKQFKNNKLYFGHGTDNAWDEAVYLVLHALHLSPLLAIPNYQVTPKEKKAILRIIERRIKKRVPAAYLTGEAWFAGLPFWVDKRVLIPRSPLAELIINHFAPWINPNKVARILDMGTGSGCIAISCGYAFPEAKVDAVDISVGALKLAAINGVRHGMTKRLRLIHSNLFQKLQGETYDIIISNPPYVGKKELQTLPKEYQHEPKRALLAGSNGIGIVAQILENAANYLTPRGILVVEVGNSAQLLMQAYPELPFIWLEFEHGDGEVFLLTREQLLSLRARLPH